MTGKKLYVGSLPYSTSDRDLEDLFAEFGTVASAQVITDRMTGRSRGFGFVEMSTSEEAEQAAQKLNGTQLEGRSLVVNEAKQREGFGGGGGGGGRRSGGGGGQRRW